MSEDIDKDLDELLGAAVAPKKEEKKEKKKVKKEATPPPKPTEPEITLPEPKEEEVRPQPPPPPAPKTEPKTAAPKSKREAITLPIPATQPAGEIKLPEEVEKVIESIDVIEEEQVPTKYIIMIYGDKGSGKTTTALSFPGEVCVLSFDRKATPIKQHVFNGVPRIHVFDAVKFMNWDPKVVTGYAEATFQYIKKILKYCEEKLKCDWLVFDGTEIMEQICEMVMRYRHGLDPFQGVKNLNIWKERKFLLRDLHNAALNAARKGVIYTTYTQYEDLVVEGELVTRKEVPKWIDVIMFETDVVLKTEYDARNKLFRVKVVTSKLDKVLPTGKYYDVTNNPLGAQIKF